MSSRSPCFHRGRLRLAITNRQARRRRQLFVISENVTQIAKILAQSSFMRLYSCPSVQSASAHSDSARTQFTNPRGLRKKILFFSFSEHRTVNGIFCAAAIHKFTLTVKFVTYFPLRRFHREKVLPSSYSCGNSRHHSFRFNSGAGRWYWSLA